MVHNCTDDHAAIIHPLLLLVLLGTKKKFSHKNCVLLRTKPGEKKIGPRVEEDRKSMTGKLSADLPPLV